MHETTENEMENHNTSEVKGEGVFDTSGITILASDDNINYDIIAQEEYPVMNQSDRDGIYNHTLRFAPLSTRYVKVIAKTEREMPEWHTSKGTPAFMFVDEVTIN